MVALLVFPTCYSFHNVHRSTFLTKHRAQTCLFINLNWFGGSKNEDDGFANGETLATEGGKLGGVSGIMQSMDNFRKSQKIGKTTGMLVQELSSTVVEGTAENGKVKVLFNGLQQPIGIQIDEGFFEASSTTVNDLTDAINTAMDDGYTKSKEKMDEKMKAFFLQMNLPTSK
jgi:DNA-binding protein YbaB